MQTNPEDPDSVFFVPFRIRPVMNHGSNEDGVAKTMKFRIAFSFFFLLGMNIAGIYNSTPNTIGVTAAQCFKDITFIWTENVNIFMREHVYWKDAYVIYCGFLMDFLMISFLVFFYLYWRTTRMVFAMILMYGLRGFI